jgi:electron transfer flavoprotein alpha/beta subunit
VVLKAKVGSVVYVFKYTNGKWFVRGKDKQFTEPVVDEKRINQLNDLAATGKNDADQVKKDDAGNVKSSDTDVKSTEKPDSEKDTSKVDDKSKIKETFKSEYKNYF